MNSDQSPKAPIIGIRRHRIDTDGYGVTTLVGFHGCPLQCRYCLNPQCHMPSAAGKYISPEKLHSMVKADTLYFLATGGGICFGGGEPCLYSRFISRFREICDKKWKITIETSLHVPQESIECLLPAIDTWIVDIKDLNTDIYRAYTGASNTKMLNNLRLLSDVKDKCIIRIPKIPDYNTDSHVKANVKAIRSMGFTNINVFSYKTLDHE